MSEIEERIYNDILTLIKDNLRILIYNHDSCLYYFNNYCKKNYDSKKIIGSISILTRKMPIFGNFMYAPRRTNM